MSIKSETERTDFLESIIFLVYHKPNINKKPPIGGFLL
jgi:hypothetical protein